MGASLAQVLFGRACPLLGEDARVVGGMELFFHLLQLAGQAAGPRLLAAQQCLEVRQLAFDGEDSRRASLRLPADDERSAHDVAVQRDESGMRACLGTVDCFAKRADDVRLGDGQPHGLGHRARAHDRECGVAATGVIRAVRRSLLEVERDECTTSCATLAQPLDCGCRRSRIIDDYGLRDIL